MKMRYYLRWPAFVAAGILAGSVVTSSWAKDEKTTASPEEMMKKMAAAGQPGPTHQAMEALVGDWNVEVKTWMDPKSEPTVTKGTAKATWAMNGRFVQEEFRGEMMGKPFQGLSFTGYDNTKKKFNNVWMDDMHTTMFTSEGSSDAGLKTITLQGAYDCPITGEKGKQMKQVIRIVSNDKHVFEMYDLNDGETVKTMEITYTRKG